MTHSPGPWYFTANMYGINNMRVFGVENLNGPFPEGVANCGVGVWSEANARLIAAAPEMFEAIQDLFEQRKYIKGFDFTKLENAFEKATGEKS